MFDLGSLNPQQREAVRTIHGPVLILAGAGTGKTRVITSRTAWMIQNDIPPENILAVTFTNKAAREMKQRVGQMMPRRSAGKRSRGSTICTFHSLGARILRQHIDRLGYKKNFVIYNDAEQLGVIKKILSHISDKGDKADPRAVLSLLSRFKNKGPEEAASWGNPNVAALAEHVRTRYDSALRACNAVDFDDLLLLTLRLFREHPEVLESCRHQFQYVMVDEYQDTNQAQFDLVHLLCQKHRNLCVVGDDDQSIYGWRGAEIANLLDLEKHYREVKVVKLEQNYRSTSSILSAANAVIRHNARRRGKQLWSDNGEGKKIGIYEFESDEEEARTVADLIEFARHSQRVPWADQAILFRTNQQSRALELALRQAGIKYHLIGGQSYFDRREVRDFLAYLKTFLNPHDEVSLLRIANTPARGLSDLTMERLLAASQERHASVYSVMRHTDVLDTFQRRTRHSLQAFVELVETTRQQLQTEPPFSLSRWAEHFLDEVAYFAELKRSEKNQEIAENRIRNLRELILSLETGPERQHLPPAEQLQKFLEDVTLDSEREEDKENTGDAVTLITMHSCKGLEFPHVYVVGLEDGLLPHTRSKEEGTLDEERRLFYVSITRAMKTLTLSYCLSRRKYGQNMPCHPSPFLKELPPDLVEHAHEKAKEPVATDSGKSFFSAMRNALE